MGTSINVGGSSTPVECFCHPDLHRVESAVDEARRMFKLANLGMADGDARAKTLARLAEALAKGDLSLEVEILRRWGIR